MNRFRRRTPLLTLMHWGVLLAFAWPGPLPVGHSHDELLEGPAANDVRLASFHLSRFHRDRAIAPELSLEWHVHWIFVGASGELGGRPLRGPVQIPDDSVAPPAIDPPLLSNGFGLDRLVFESLGPPIGSIERTSYLTVGLLSADRSLPELLGIMRC